MNMQTMMFFSSHPELLPLYEHLEEAMMARCPGTEVVVSKSQIAFTVARRFAYASIRGKRFIVTFGLPEQVSHPRIWQSTEPYPNRWTHHVMVSRPEEIDETLLDWIDQAYQFASRK